MSRIYHLTHYQCNTNANHHLTVCVNPFHATKPAISLSILPYPGLSVTTCLITQHLPSQKQQYTLQTRTCHSWVHPLCVRLSNTPIKKGVMMAPLPKRAKCGGNQRHFC
jgi:hypothetical protein